MIPNKLKTTLVRGQADPQRLVLDRQRLHRGNHGGAGLRLRHRRRAARRARLFEPVADAAGDARVRRRSDGARAVARAGHHHEGARRRRLWHHLPDGEQRRSGGGVRQLHALSPARAAQFRADAGLVRRRRRLRRPRQRRNARLRDDRDGRGHGEPVVDRRDARPRRALCRARRSHARPRAGSPRAALRPRGARDDRGAQGDRRRLQDQWHPRRAPLRHARIRRARGSRGAST